jgi:hypothetical protein
MQSKSRFCENSCGESSMEDLPVRGAPLHCLDRSTVDAVSPHNMFDLFQCGFELPKSAPFEEFQTEMSTVIFYNLALAHHLAGLSGAENAETHLEEALRFYKISLTVFKSQPASHFQSSCYPVVLGLITNLGHVFAHFCKIKEARSCNVHLEQLLESPAVRGLSEEEGEFFFSAVAFSSAHQFAIAPAA